MGKRNWCAILMGCAMVLVISVESASAGVPACAPPCIKGDVNNDGAVNNLDIGPFLDVMLAQNVDPVAVCTCDLNGDGKADGLDISGLVSSLLCGCGCTVETDCALGENCVNGLCEPAGVPDLELSDNNAPCVTTGYARIEDGGVFNLCEGWQTAVELFLTVRATGFAPNAVVDASYTLTVLNPQACAPTCPAGEFCFNGGCVLDVLNIPNAQMTDIGGGVNQYTGLAHVILVVASFLEGKDALLTVTITDTTNPLITASISLCVELHVFGFCIFPSDCPPNHDCVGSYCVPI